MNPWIKLETHISTVHDCKLGMQKNTTELGKNIARKTGLSGERIEPLKRQFDKVAR